MNGLKGKLKNSKLVAHEANTKSDKKPSAVHYYYYQFNIGNETYYFNIEENVVAKESRRFFRLYALTRSVRDTAIWY